MKMLAHAAFAAALVASSSAFAGGPPLIQKPTINIQVIGTKSSGSTSVTSNQTGTVNFLGVGMLGGKNDVTATQNGQFNAAYIGQAGKAGSATLLQNGGRLNYGQIYQRQTH